MYVQIVFTEHPDDPRETSVNVWLVGTPDERIAWTTTPCKIREAIRYAASLAASRNIPFKADMVCAVSC